MISVYMAGFVTGAMCVLLAVILIIKWTDDN